MSSHPKKDKSHYMLFFPENLLRMFKLLDLKNIKIEYSHNKQKLDKIIRLFPRFKRNTIRTFTIIGKKY
ncbi:MAG: hypothetical protein ACTSQO_04980 [Candidatus Helarchaeota archaeon]